MGLGVVFAWVNYQKICFNSQDNKESEVLVASSPTILVDIEGAVKSPGVYQLKSGAVFFDALNVAGGLKSDADPDFVRDKLNLAQRVGSGEKLVIPSLSDLGFDQSAEEWCQEFGQPKKMSSSSLGPDSSSILGNTPLSSGGHVSINTATAEDLMSLSGIGEKRAEDIIENRPYQSLNELVERGVLSENLLSDLSGQLEI